MLASHPSPIRFRAIPQTQCTLPVADSGWKKDVIVYELEPKDSPVLDVLEKRIVDKTLLPEENGKNDKEAHYETLQMTVNDAQRILRQRQDRNTRYHDTSVIYMAVSEKRPCGLLIGNMPKLDKNGEITHTYRGKPLKEETELDRMAVWPLESIETRLKGIGQVLLSQFYNFCQGLTPRPDTIYIRAETPEKGVAVDFYKDKMGVRQIQEEPILEQVPDGPVSIVTYLYNPTSEIDPYPVIPMEISVDRAGQIARSKKVEFNAQSLEHHSVAIQDVVDLKRLAGQAGY